MGVALWYMSSLLFFLPCWNERRNEMLSCLGRIGSHSARAGARLAGTGNAARAHRPPCTDDVAWPFQLSRAVASTVGCRCSVLCRTCGAAMLRVVLYLPSYRNSGRFATLNRITFWSDEKSKGFIPSSFSSGMFGSASLRFGRFQKNPFTATRYNGVCYFPVVVIPSVETKDSMFLFRDSHAPL